MKILIINQHTSNFGDDAAGLALVNNLLKYNFISCIEILYCMKGELPIKDKRVFHNHDLFCRDMRIRQYILYSILGIETGKFIPGFIEKVLSADLTIVSPCGANLGIYKDRFSLMQDLIITKLHCPLIFHLNTIGASGNRLFDASVLKVCRKSKVYVREKASLRYLQSKGVVAKFGTDSAFSLVNPIKVANKENKIIFVPSNVWKWHVDFKKENSFSQFQNVLNQIGKFALDNKLEIQISPHTNSEQEKEFNFNIKNYLKEEFSNLVIDVIKINTCYEYENAIQSARFVVGMRYHTIVFAAKNFIPFIALSYEQKMNEVSEYTGQQEYCIDLKKISNNSSVYNKLKQMLTHEDEIRHSLKNKHSELVESSKIVMREEIEKLEVK